MYPERNPKTAAGMPCKLYEKKKEERKKEKLFIYLLRAIQHCYVWAQVYIISPYSSTQRSNYSSTLCILKRLSVTTEEMGPFPVINMHDF